MSNKYKEIVNFQHVVRMNLYGDDSVVLSFVNGYTRNYDFKTSKEAQDMMKHFEAWCVFGSSVVTPSFVIYEDDLPEGECEMRACPFCGGTNICTVKGINLNYCDSCSAEANIEHWNTRPIEDDLESRIVELEQALNIDTDLTIAGLRKELLDAQTRIAELEESEKHWASNAKVCMQLNEQYESRITELSQALGLITTLKPTMVMDVDHPLDMAKEVEAYVTARIAVLEKALNIDTDLTIAGLRVELRDATARIAELEEAQRWIPVSERLPEAKGHYMAVMVDGFDDSRSVETLRYFGDGDWFTWSYWHVVTHWKEKPELPEVQE